MKRSSIRFVLIGALVVGAGLAMSCSSSDEGNPDTGGADGVVDGVDSEDSASDTAATDTVESTDAATDIDTHTGIDADSIETDVDPCAACANGLCVDGVCVECVGDENCSFPRWCRDNECVETLCLGGAERCEAGNPQVCADDGESWIDQEPCPEEFVCAQGKCQQKVCEPGHKYCQSLRQWVCNSAGTGYAEALCPPGTACFDGAEQCTSVRPNLLLIFDTSGSMGPAPILDVFPCVCGFGNCPKLPYPACEDTNCPRSKLGLAKKVLLDLFESPTFEGIRFAMTRFPQRVSVKKNPSCDDLVGVGNYVAAPAGVLTGDGDYHVAPEGGYFENNLSEILAVPFPVDEEFDSQAAAVAWVDSDEVFETFGVECTKHADCYPDVCATDSQTGMGQCGRHTNPELRPAGSTPLGKSLFYAGEYVRKYVVVQGKECAEDADCGNVNYFCGPKNTCYDPLRECRKTIVVLFTDGGETENTELSDFFHPRVQAKRLHYGLGCAFDSHCSNGAKCQNAICQGYAMPNSGTAELLPYIDGDGANRLTDYVGNPIPLTVHVVDMSEGGEVAKDNKRIADHGGGVFYPVESGDPEKLLEAFESTIDVKANIKQCIPEFPEE